MFVIAIPFIQFLILRRPAHGNQSIAERIAEAVASKFGIHTPLGLRASKAAFQRRNSAVHNEQPPDRKLIISFLPNGLPRTPVLAPCRTDIDRAVSSAPVLHGPLENADAAAAGLFNASQRQMQLQRMREANTKSYLMKMSFWL